MRLLIDERETMAKLARLVNREKAREMALRAHDGQQDKAGRSYLAHVVRVAVAVSDDPIAETAAWLHDVIEDHPGFEAELVATFPEPVLVAVRLLTRDKDQPAEDYYRAIAGNPIALRVKLAVVADNSDESRLCLLPEEVSSRLRVKYARAMEMLQSGAGAGEVVIDLDAEFVQRMKETVAQQTWMPAEYVANDWQADILDFLSNGPSTFVDPHVRHALEDKGRIHRQISNELVASKSHAGTGTGRGWLRDGSLLYRLTNDHRPTNTDEIRVTMANGSREDSECEAGAIDLLAGLSRPTPNG